MERKRTRLSSPEETQFQSDYAEIAKQAGIDPNPDHPAHQYDYRGAWKAGYRRLPDLKIDPEDQRPHWPSQFKDEDHPTRFKNGVDTRNSIPNYGGNLRDLMEMK